ncbi:MAG: hypothetical protein JWN14_3407 [Chthonomonadales bacterium]|nr:hypothetical protein [Chthonomonadales bacterium]
MASFELIFEADEDVLEVTFEAFDESFARTISLNDNIQLYTDLMFQSVWGLTFYSYSQLLQVSETHLDGLTLLEEPDRNRLLALLAKPPASRFLNVFHPGELRALVQSPSLQELMRF